MFSVIENEQFGAAPPDRFDDPVIRTPMMHRNLYVALPQHFLDTGEILIRPADIVIQQCAVGKDAKLLKKIGKPIRQNEDRLIRIFQKFLFVVREPPAGAPIDLR